MTGRADPPTPDDQSSHSVEERLRLLEERVAKLEWLEAPLAEASELIRRGAKGA